MKKRLLKVLLSVLLIFVLLITAALLQKNYILKNTMKYQTIISEQSLSSTTNTYPLMNDEVEVFKLNINLEKEIRFNYWKKDLLGKVEFVILNSENGKTLSEFVANEGYNNKILKLEKGNYIIKAKVNSFMGGFVLGYDNMIIDQNPQEDTDNDGLPDNYETKYGTDIHNKDTDGDGLSDYQEILKYKTNPLKKDSDSDGILDSDWAERREYTYTVQAIVDLRVPHNIKDMNDIFQDAKLIQEIDKNTSRVEVILYPEASIIINPTIYNRNAASNEYTKPTFTKNYSSKMKEEIAQKVKNLKTDIQSVVKLISELGKTKSVDIVKDLKMDTDMPLDLTLIKSNNIPMVSPGRNSSSYSMDEILKQVLFADSMYEKKTRGACGSTAILRGGLMRSAGLQERSIFTIPLFFSFKSDNAIYKINEKYLNKECINLPNDGKAWWSDHVLNEVFIRNQWVQVDFSIRDSFQSFNNPWYIKTISFNDPSEVDFYNKYSNLDFFKERPYKYLSVIEQEKKYK